MKLLAVAYNRSWSQALEQCPMRWNHPGPPPKLRLSKKQNCSISMMWSSLIRTTITGAFGSDRMLLSSSGDGDECHHPGDDPEELADGAENVLDLRQVLRETR